jgi:hypothetical protein
MARRSSTRLTVWDDLGDYTDPPRYTQSRGYAVLVETRQLTDTRAGYDTAPQWWQMLTAEEWRYQLPVWWLDGVEV